MRVPFSIYDFFGYLASGFLVLAATEFAFDGNWLVEREWKPGVIVLYVTMAYILGHILATPSSHFLEWKFCRDLLGPSEEILLGKEKEGLCSCWKSIFPNFFRPLPKATIDRIFEKAPDGLKEPGRALYNHAFAVVKRDDNTLARLNNFLNMYGFCRNICFALLVAAIIIVMSGIWYATVLNLTETDWRKVGIAVLCVVGAFGMLHRYLKFYRHYTNEVLNSYPEVQQKQ